MAIQSFDILIFLEAATGFPTFCVFVLEYLLQSNDNAYCVGLSDRYKFVDDLSILEIVNLLTVGLTSFNLKQQVPSDIPLHNQFIPAETLVSQELLDKRNDWTEEKKMMINENK